MLINNSKVDSGKVIICSLTLQPPLLGTFDSAPFLNDSKIYVCSFIFHLVCLQWKRWQSIFGILNFSNFFPLGKIVVQVFFCFHIFVKDWQTRSISFFSLVCMYVDKLIL